jgi:hypothetical protein
MPVFAGEMNKRAIFGIFRADLGEKRAAWKGKKGLYQLKH